MEQRKRKIKYPLKMKDDYPVRTVEEFREHFDLVKMLEYAFTTVEDDANPDGTLKNGKLTNWLRLRYYENAANAVSALREDDPQLAEKLCEIMGATYPEDIPDISTVQKTVQRRAILRRWTTNEDVLANPMAVAFNQSEFEHLYFKSKSPVIYLFSVKDEPFIFKRSMLIKQGSKRTLFGIDCPKLALEGILKRNIVESNVIVKSIAVMPTASDELGDLRVFTLGSYGGKDLKWRIIDEDNTGVLTVTEIPMTSQDRKNFLSLKITTIFERTIFVMEDPHRIELIWRQYKEINPFQMPEWSLDLKAISESKFSNLFNPYSNITILKKKEYSKYGIAIDKNTAYLDDGTGQLIFAYADKLYLVTYVEKELLKKHYLTTL